MGRAYRVEIDVDLDVDIAVEVAEGVCVVGLRCAVGGMIGTYGVGG